MFMYASKKTLRASAFWKVSISFQPTPPYYVPFPYEDQAIKDHFKKLYLSHPSPRYVLIEQNWRLDFQILLHHPGLLALVRNLNIQ